MALDRPSARRAYSLLMSPLSGPGGPGKDGAPCALRFSTDPDSDAFVEPATLERLFGLTRREAEVAASLAAGYRVRDAAASRP